MGQMWILLIKRVCSATKYFKYKPVILLYLPENPLELQAAENNRWQFNNINGHVDSKGAETNMKIKYKDFGLFLGYTYTDADVKEDGRSYQKP